MVKPDFPALNKKLLLNLVLHGTLIAGIQNAHSACWGPEPHQQLNIQMNVGRVVIKPDSQIGDVLKESRFEIQGVEKSVWCNVFGGDYIDGIILQGAPTNFPNVYDTNIPGIGISMFRKRDDITDVYYPHEGYARADGYTELASGFFHIKIIRIGEKVGTGALISGLYTTYRLRGEPDKPLLTSTLNADALTIVMASCNVESGSKDKVINLDDVSTSAFSGTGSVAGEKAFDINLTCISNPISSSDPETVSLRFDYLPDSYGQGVIKSQPGDNAAAGVAVQLLTDKNIPVGNQERVKAGKIAPVKNSTLTVPLKARYIRIPGNITPGSVQATATFTIEYK